MILACGSVRVWAKLAIFAIQRMPFAIRAKPVRETGEFRSQMDEGAG